MIPVNDVIAFAVATFGKASILADSRVSCRRERAAGKSMGVVGGVALANIAWVVVVALLRTSFPVASG